jgi:hypothetical protein
MKPPLKKLQKEVKTFANTSELNWTNLPSTRFASGESTQELKPYFSKQHSKLKSKPFLLFFMQRV